MLARARSRTYWLVALAVAGCAGGNDTRIHLEVAVDPALDVDNYQVHLGDKTALSPVATTLDVEIPDSDANQSQTLQMWGLAAGQQVAYGSAAVTPQLHQTVTAVVTLNAVTCGPLCTDGEIECSGGGTATCEVQPTGCLAFSTVTPCPATTPECEDGACVAQCSDECAAGSTECDGSGAQRACGMFDSTCLVWSPPMACLTGQTCGNGVCGTSCTANGSGCDDANPCTISDTCEHGTCAGTPKCTTAPANADPTCGSDGTCSFTCHTDFAPSGTVCAPAAVAPLGTSRGYPATVLGSDGQIYAIGGASSTSLLSPLVALNVVEAYNPSTNVWTVRAPMPTARYEHGAAVGADGLIYVIGGDTGTAYSATVEAYNPATNTWATRTPMPTARSRLSVVIGADHIIYAIGGEIAGTVAGTVAQTGVVEAYNPATDTWTTKTAMPTAREAMAAALGPDAQIYVIGGLDGGTTSSDVATVEAFKPSTSSWTTVAPLATAYDDLAAATGPDGLIYAVGGYAGIGTMTTLAAYSTTSNTWTAKAALPTARADHGAVATSSLLYAIGGYSPVAGTTTATVDAYSFADNIW